MSWLLQRISWISVFLWSYWGFKDSYFLSAFLTISRNRSSHRRILFSMIAGKSSKLNQLKLNELLKILSWTWNDATPNFINKMNHCLLVNCNILQKQRCPSVNFIKESFCWKFLCYHSALNILESCNYLWYEPVLQLWRSGKKFPQS